MALNLVNIDPRELLTLLKTEYYNQTGEQIQIGSNDFATASVQSYVWSVLLNNLNEATKNRFLESASGEYLDALAFNYGILERPKGYHSTASFHLILNHDGVTIPANSLVISDDAGNKFTNPYTFNASIGHGTDYTVLQAIEAGSRYNNIPIGEIHNIDQGSVYISAAENETMSQGGTDGFPYTEEGDAEYREWLKTEIQSYSGAGTYQAYEARAKNADSRILDTYVLRQNDEGYEKGKVQIFILSDTDYDLESQCLTIVKNACDDPSFRPIGDLVIVEYSGLTDVDISTPIQVTYPSRFSSIADSRNNRILNEYGEMLRSKINRPFTFEELCALFTKKDSDGVYAVDAKPLNLGGNDYPDAIYPEIGARLNIQDISIINHFSNVGE
jgi:phage-related baseplate assembly protein